MFPFIGQFVKRSVFYCKP